MLLREEVRDGDHGESDEEPLEDEVAELREELDEEPKVTPRDEPKVIPLVPVDEPRIVMLHETKPAPRSIEPAPTNGARKADANERPEQRERPERSPVLLKGLRPPSDAPPRRRSRGCPICCGPRPSRDRRARAKPQTLGTRRAPASRAPHVEPKGDGARFPRFRRLLASSYERRTMLREWMLRETGRKATAREPKPPRATSRRRGGNSWIA